MIHRRVSLENGIDSVRSGHDDFETSYTTHHPVHFPGPWRTASAAKLQAFRVLTDDNVTEKIPQRESELIAAMKML